MFTIYYTDKAQLEALMNVNKEFIFAYEEISQDRGRNCSTLYDDTPEDAINLIIELDWPMEYDEEGNLNKIYTAKTLCKPYTVQIQDLDSDGMPIDELSFGSFHEAAMCYKAEVWKCVGMRYRDTNPMFTINSIRLGRR